MGELSKSLMLLSTSFPLLKPPPPRLLTVGCRVSTISLSIVVFPCSIRLHSAHFRPVRFASPLRSLGAQSGESLWKWPEWLKMVEYVAGLKGDEDPFDGFEEMPEDFSATARACLLFARERPDLLRSLPKKDIEILVENSSPFLFKNSQNSVRRMKAFIKLNEENALGSEPAFTVDLMKYLLTCVYEHYHGSGVVEKNPTNLVESSARSLLHELTKIDKSRSGSSRRQLTGREWECPQCEFFNHSKNASCLRCDLRRPEDEIPRNKISSTRNGEELKEIAESEISLKLDRILGRLSSPTAEPASTTITSGAAVAGSLEEDIDGFPEIMPMRKGENRFVVSKKKDRSLTSPQYKRRAAMDQAASSNFVPFVPFPPGYFAKKEDKNGGDDDGGSGSGGGGDGDDDDDDDHDDVVGDDDDDDNDDRREASNIKEVHQQDMSEEAKAERWFKRVAQINDISELSNIPDEDFPEIMPMRKGVNRFVVSKRKTPLERRLTSPQNRRNLTQEKSTPRYPFSEEQKEL